jgi:uncharacterized protein (TIGR00251 family)
LSTTSPQACSKGGLLTAASDGIRVAIRLTPRSRADRIERIERIGRSAENRPALKVSVTAPAAEGRANNALVQLLAKEFRVPKRDIALIAGQKSRDKMVHITGDPAALLSHIGALIVALPRS